MNKLISHGAPVGVLAAGALAFALLYAARPEPEKKTEPPRPLTVFVEDVYRADTDLVVETTGEVRARTEVDIVAQVTGRITEVSPEFIEGGIVTAEAPLVRIEDIDYRLALSQARVRLAEAKLGLEQARADADVARKQLRDATTASDLALKRPHIAEAEARLAAARAAMEQAELEVSRTAISLPFDGRIRETNVNIGQFVTAGTRLGRAFSTESVEVRLPLHDDQLAAIGLPIGYVATPGKGPEVTFSARVAGRESHWRGRLVRLDASVDPKTRMIFGTARVDSPYTDNRSRHGMPMAVGLFVHAEIKGRRIENARVIPRQALRAGDRVYVVGRSGRLEIRDVDVAHSSETQAVIASGVSPGERVIVSSVRNPIEGMALEAMRQTDDDSAVADSRPPSSEET
ncbi:MAG: efflux RND transporter periplasmic adaptor subunit [Gammaproteobacteria bacterium]|nr:efflux RND transporter periplasmic adaptor subunit [Gammaproteobacteria bacterium]